MPEWFVAFFSNWWVNFIMWVVSTLVLFNFRNMPRMVWLFFVGMAIFSGLYFIL